MNQYSNNGFWIARQLKAIISLFGDTIDEIIANMYLCDQEKEASRSSGSIWDGDVIPNRINIYGSHQWFQRLQSRYTCSSQYFVHNQPVLPGDIVIATTPMPRITPPDNTRRNVYIKDTGHLIVGVTDGKAIYLLDGLNAIGRDNIEYYRRLFKQGDISINAGVS